jgi:uncharacterized membrane protein
MTRPFDSMEYETQRLEPAICDLAAAAAGAPVPVAASGKRHVASWSVALAIVWTLAAAVILWRAAPYLIGEGRYAAFYGTRMGALVVHIAAGSLALLTGPVQFWLGLTGRSAALHRALGRTYGAALCVSAAAALVLLAQSRLGPVFITGALTLTLVWVGCTAAGVLAIRRGDLERHRAWMLRSYVAGLAFVIDRAGEPLLVAAGMADPVARATLMIWVAWPIPLLLLEFALQRRRASPPLQVAAA